MPPKFAPTMRSDGAGYGQMRKSTFEPKKSAFELLSNSGAKSAPTHLRPNLPARLASEKFLARVPDPRGDFLASRPKVFFFEFDRTSQIALERPRDPVDRHHRTLHHLLEHLGVLFLLFIPPTRVMVNVF